MSNVIPFPVRRKPRQWTPADITPEQSRMVFQWLRSLTPAQRKRAHKRARAYMKKHGYQG